MPEETQTADIDMAAIEAEARAEVLGEELPEKKAEEAKQPEQAKEPEEEGETDADAAPVEEDGDKEPEEDQEVAAEDKPKKKKSWGEREREKRLEAEAQFSEQLRQRDSEIAELKALVKQSLTGEKKEAKQPKKEWLDPEAQEEFEGTKEEIQKFKEELKNEIKTEKFVGGFREMELAVAKEDPLYEQKIDHLIALDAADILATSNVSQKEAIERAATNYLAKCRALFDGGKNPALYMKGRAEMLFPQFRQSAQPKQKKATVDMKAMQELRDSAGAPTNKSVAATNGVVLDIDAIEKQARKEVLEAATYL